MLALVGATDALAADPIMRLADVKAGMHCTGRSVIRGTTISSFDAEVIDVIQDVSGPAILIRASGPAVDETGIGFGFSGSPIYCKDAHGVSRNAGAVAFGLGDYGNKLAGVTPIEAILDEPIAPVKGARRLTARERASRRQLSAPLTLTGLTPWLAGRLRAAASRRGEPVYAAPSGPLKSFPPQQLVPGSSLSVGLSSGDLALSAIGTVAYTDGNSVWGFGHPLDAAGPRSLLLQDAYVYTVVNDPNGDIAGSYKLAAPGHDIGTLSGDYLNAVTGTVGPLPSTTRLHIHAHDLDTGRELVSDSHVADEIDLGSNIGISPLGIVAPIGILDAGVRLLHSDPGRTTARMCLRVMIAGHARPLRFCNRYVGDNSVAGSAGLLAASDADEATLLLESVQFPGIRVESMSADVQLRRGLAQAYLARARAPRHVRRDGALHVKAAVKVLRGSRRHVSFDVPVPHALPPGQYALTLSGPGPDGTGGGDGGSQDDLVALLSELFSPGGAGDLGPTSFKSLARQFAAFRRYDGLTARFVASEPEPVGPSARRHRRPPGSRRLHVYVNPDFRIGGRLVVPVRVGHH
ncbi:MAG: hypothetical protein QOG86_1610 [Thermoleophilaceae bacterium]|nr:hypothetical protein [Thermoleophilaceae bacterium]